MLGGEGLSRSRLARSVVIIFIIGVISRVLGFFREMVLAAVFGASQVTDAYTITFSIPFVVFAAFGSAITTVVLPLLAHYRARGRHEDLQRVAWTLFHALLVLLLGFLAVLMAGVDVVLRLFAPGFTGETLELARRLALILLPGILFMGMNGWLQAVHNSARSFTAPAMVGIPMNLILIAGTYFLGRRFGIEAVAALMTPAVLAAVGAVVKYLIAEVGNVIGVRAWLHRVLRRKGRPAEGGQSGAGQSAEPEITLDATQLARVREIVLATCRQVGAPEDRSLLLANGVVGALSSGD